jgi:hypothetical protein
LFLQVRERSDESFFLIDVSVQSRDQRLQRFVFDVADRVVVRAVVVVPRLEDR